MENQIRYYRILFSNWTNSFIYALSKIPFIGDILFSKLYGKYKLKRLFGFIGFFIKSFVTVVGQIIKCYLFLIYIPNFLLKNKGVMINDDIGKLAIMYVLIIILAELFNHSYVFTSSVEDNLFLNNFNLDPNVYYKNKFIKFFILRFLGNLLFLIFIIGNSKYIVILLSSYAIFELMNLNFNCIYFRHHEKLPANKVISIYKHSIIGITLLLLYFNKLVVLNLNNIKWTLINIVVSILIFISIILFKRICNYGNYKRVSLIFLNKTKISISVSNGSEFYESTETNAKEFSHEVNKEFLDKNSNMKYVKYIENAFRERFKKLMIRNIKGRVISPVIVLLLITIILKLNIFSIDRNNPLQYSPFLLTFIIGQGYSEEFLKLCFRNYDMPFMYQRMFNRDSLEKQVLGRTLFILKISLITLISFTSALLVFIYINRINLSSKEIVNYIIIYSCIFIALELHNIVIYYIIEPYNIELTAFNGKYIAANKKKTLLQASLLFVRGNILIVKTPVMIILSIYILLVIITSKFANKTFKLRY